MSITLFGLSFYQSILYMMTLKHGITSAKARELLAYNLKEASRHIPPDVKLSLALALECFKHYEMLRHTGVIPEAYLLPGELPPVNHDLPFDNLSMRKTEDP